MGAHRFERHAGRRTVGFAVFVAVGCCMWILAASAQASTVPVIDSESVSNVTATDATLEASINSQEAPPGDYYQFQVVTNPSGFASEILCPSTRPQGAEECVGPQSPGVPPIGFHPSSFEHLEKPVSLDLNSAGVTLKPGTTYHYRVLAARRVQTEDTIQWEPPTVYGPDQTFTTPPAIEGESVSNITPTDATIEAQINTGGLETSYEVWVGTIGCIEENLGAVCHSTSPGEIVGTILAGASIQTVSIDVAKAWHKLAPNSSYVFTVSATNSAGKANSNFKIFKTAAGVQPAIEGESVSNITPTDATLEAQVNSEGLETTYQFRLESGCLWPRECEAIAVYPMPSGTLLGSFVNQSISLDLNSSGVTLAPGVEYAYSVTATNAAGSVAGHEQRFTTPEDGVQPLNTNPTPGSHPTGEPASNTEQGTVTPTANDSADNHGTPSPKATGLMNGRKLAKALKACGKKPKKQLASCKKQAHKKYGATTR